MKTLMIVETRKGRERLLRHAEENLAGGEAIVKIVDTVEDGAVTLTVPTDAGAEIVAREPPKVEADGATLLTSYVRVPNEPYEGIEYTLDDGEVVSSREVTLEAERIGKDEQPKADAQA